MASGSLTPVERTTAVNVGVGPSLAMALTYVAMADSLGLAMANAVSNQQRGQVLADAALAQVLAMILKAGSKTV